MGTPAGSSHSGAMIGTWLAGTAKRAFGWAAGPMAVGPIDAARPRLGVWPLPPAPVLYFPYIFLVYMAIGVIWVLTHYGRKPAASEVVRKDLDYTHAQFKAVGSET